MKQIIEYLKTGSVEVVDTPVPHCGPYNVLVRTRASLISPGTEKMLIEMGRKGLVSKALARKDLVRLAYNKAKREGFLNVFREAMARLDTPLPLGYSLAGTVMEIGASVRDLAVGDDVACTGAAYANHAEFASVPQEMCIRIPRVRKRGTKISFEEASFVMLGGIALHGIRSGSIRFGETVVVIGLGLVGLITAQILRAYGCVVVATDVDESKIRLARSLGCEYARRLDPSALESLVLNLTGGRGADAVLVTAASKDNAPLLLGETLARQRARIVLVGVSDIHLTRKAFWDKELLFTVSKASGPAEGSQESPAVWTERKNHEEFLRLLSKQHVDVRSLITHRFPVSAATQAYEMILRGRQAYVGVVVEYGPDAVADATIRVTAKESRVASTDRTKDVGVIGAGLFARNFLLPAIAHTPEVRLRSVASTTGPSAQHAAKRFGFERATTDVHSLLASEDIGSVFVVTRHDSHAPIVVEALRAGKRVFVEKPLAIDAEGVKAVAHAIRAATSPILMVGFNRRYSPLAVRLQSFFEERTTPLQMLYRVNAGFIDPGHWTQDPNIGGGRIIGEVCHFIDLMQFFTGATPTTVDAKSIGGHVGRFQTSDNVSLTIRFDDGSLGTIVYTAMGSKVFARERVEIFCDERVGVLDDFRELTLYRGGKRERTRLRGQNMGYRQEIEAYFSLTPERCSSLIHQSLATTRSTIAAVESLASGRSVTVDAGVSPL